MGRVTLEVMGKSSTRPCWWRSSGTYAMPAVMAAEGLSKVTAWPARMTSPESRLSMPKSTRATSLRPAPTSPAMPTISPPRTLKLTSSKAPWRLSPLTSQQHLAGRRVDLREERHLAPDHVAHQVGGGQLTGPGVDHEAAVAKHGGRVADVEDLVQPVADEEHRHLAVAGLAHDGEEPLHLVCRERCGGLIEDEHAGLDRQRLGDLDELLVGHRQAAHRCADVERDAQLVEQPVGRLPHLAPGDGTETTLWRMAHVDVLGDRQVREQARLLVHHGDAQGTRLRRPVEHDGRTIEAQRARVRLMDAGEDLDQGALAGTVLTDERPDLAGHQHQRDVVERLGGREPLGDTHQLGARSDRCDAAGLAGGIGRLAVGHPSLVRDERTA